MKHEAEAELLKTMNGQLSELPSVAKTMVQQYQMSAIVLSILCGVLFIVALAATTWLSVFCYRKNKTSYGDYAEGLMASLLFGGSISLMLFVALCCNIIHACAPIASIISSMFRN